MNGLMTIPHLVDKHHPTISDFFMYSQLQMAWSPPLIADPTKCPQWYPLYESPCQVMSDPTLWLWHTDTPPNIDIIPIYIICLYNIYIHIILSYIYIFIYMSQVIPSVGTSKRRSSKSAARSTAISAARWASQGPAMKGESARHQKPGQHG